MRQYPKPYLHLSPITRTWLVCLTVLLLVVWLGAGSTLAQQVLPAPHLRSVGIDPATQHYRIQWDMSSNDRNQITGFKIMKLVKQANGRLQMDSVALVDSQQSEYLDQGTMCCTPQAYSVRVTSQFFAAFEEPFRSMEINPDSLRVNECSHTIDVTWSPYQQLNHYEDNYPPVPAFAKQVQYKIYGYASPEQTYNLDSFVYLAGSGQHTRTSLDVVHEKYWHHLAVVAVYNQGLDSSWSNIVSLKVNLPLRPRYIHWLGLVSEAGHNTLRFAIDPNTEYQEFVVERAADLQTTFVPIATVGRLQTVVVDQPAEVSDITYYRVSALNSCGTNIYSSLVLHTLVAQAHNRGTTNHVEWNALQVPSSGITYAVHRVAPDWLATTTDVGMALAFDDNLKQYEQDVLQHQLCYRVEGLAEGLSVLSAQVCAAVTPEFFMPNAINPHSAAVNPNTGKSRALFEPVSGFALSYYLQVYNRWGHKVYAGSEPWGGYSQGTGEPVDAGAYLYHIRVQFANGHTAERTGNVSVVY